MVKTTARVEMWKPIWVGDIQREIIEIFYKTKPCIFLSQRSITKQVSKIAITFCQKVFLEKYNNKRSSKSLQSSVAKTSLFCDVLFGLPTVW